tara:strand:+ start:260 stop:1489 length:1230 start_codon:yes stop_codon:yes gene_type:complete
MKSLTKLYLNKAELRHANIIIPGSKSESNRLIILRSLFKNISLENISDSDDTNYLLNAINTKSNVINVGHAGTAMRFLASYLSLTTKANIQLIGSERMHNRPIKKLVDSLREIGANIEYMRDEGYPPLFLNPSKLRRKKLLIDGSTSSQYISSLLLIAPKISNGLELELIGKETSIPYINMTISLLKKIGVEIISRNKCIKVFECQNINPIKISIESDWSSASYFYSIVALAEIGYSLTLNKFNISSLQGDSKIVDIYKVFGVITTFQGGKIKLEKVKSKIDEFTFNLALNPDLAQTICITCLGLGIKCYLNGLHTLKIKETDRLVALRNEIGKFGLKVTISEDSISFGGKRDFLKPNVMIETYNDHRMAMAFACLAIKTNIVICDHNVVSKSYKTFWSDLNKIGILTK